MLGARTRRPIDFKFASAAAGLPTKQAQFDRLAVRRVRELVSFSASAHAALPASLECSAPHVSPRAFHQLLLAASEKAAAVSSGDDGVVLIDTRNIYESRIGTFLVDKVATLRPPTRTFSEFAAWCDASAPSLRNKQIFMFCTGGVRCERASAYVRAHGHGFQDVVQLDGGIVRYLEEFDADSSLFVGRNFVFDPRTAHGASGGGGDGGSQDNDNDASDANAGSDIFVSSDADAHVLAPPAMPSRLPDSARCVVCSAPHCSYLGQPRCPRCRLLILVCDTCITTTPTEALPLCDLCAARIGAPTALQSPPPSPTALRIVHLCAPADAPFNGRVQAVCKRLETSAAFQRVELVRIDALDALPPPPPPSQDTADAAVCTVLLGSGLCATRIAQWCASSERCDSFVDLVWLVDCESSLSSLPPSTPACALPLLHCTAGNASVEARFAHCTRITHEQGHELSTKFMRDYIRFLRRQ